MFRHPRPRFSLALEALPTTIHPLIKPKLKSEDTLAMMKGKGIGDAYAIESKSDSLRILCAASHCKHIFHRAAHCRTIGGDRLSREERDDGILRSMGVSLRREQTQTIFRYRISPREELMR